MKNCYKATLIIIGTVIGAGFASGQEIYSFFNIYKVNGIIGLFISNGITGLVIYKVLKEVNKNDIKTYRELLERTKSPSKLSNILNIIINIFLLMSFYIMTSGFSAYFNQEFNVPRIFTSIIVLIICYITFNRELEGITKVNNIVIPILIMSIVCIALKDNIIETICNINVSNIELKANWIMKSIEYASYNSILLIPMLISIKKYTKGNERKISIVVTFILLILSGILFFIMYKHIDIYNIEMPLVYIASKYGKMYKYIYGMVIVFAIYTTMISAGYGFLNNCSKNKKMYKTLSFIICLFVIFFSNFSFAELVKLTYPTFGILGIVQLFKVLK